MVHVYFAMELDSISIFVGQPLGFSILSGILRADSSKATKVILFIKLPVIVAL